VINGLPAKTQQIRQQAQADGKQIQRALDAIYTPVDALLAFTNGPGFKSALGPLTYANTTYTAGTLVPAVIPTVQGISASTTPFTFVAPCNGSVVGISLANNSGTSPRVDAVIFKNSALLWTATGVIAAGHLSGQTSAVSPYTFAAGDVLTVSFSVAASGNYQLQAYLLIQLSA
jgi:hypothetical protein